MRHRIKVLVALALTALFLWLFLRQADLNEVWRALGRVHYGFIALSILVVLFNQLQRAWRWRLLLSPLEQVPLWPLLEATLIGWSVTTLLPGRLGELARPVLLARKGYVKTSAAIGSVVLERVFDGLSVLVLLAAYLVLLPLPTGVGSQGAEVLEIMRTTGMLLLAAMLAGGLIAVLAMRDERVRAWVDRLARALLPGRVADLGSSFLEGMSGLRSPWLVLRIAISSLLLWGVITGIYVVLFRAFDLNLPAYAAIPLVAVLVVGAMIPTPGAVGAFHKAAQIGLVALWGVDNEVAVAYAIVSHAVTFLPHAFIGLLLLIRAGLTLGAVGRLGESAQTEPPAASL